MVAHEKALNWQDLFEIAIRTDVPEEEVVAMGYRVAGVSQRTQETSYWFLTSTTFRGSNIQEAIRGSRSCVIGLFARR